jgi:hypothetical protein
MLVQELAKAVDLVDYWVVALAVGLVKVFDLVKELVLVKVQELELAEVYLQVSDQVRVLDLELAEVLGLVAS